MEARLDLESGLGKRRGFLTTASRDHHCVTVVTTFA
jgi:hypothetical protein